MNGEPIRRNGIAGEMGAGRAASMHLFSKRLKLSAGTFQHGLGEQVVRPMKRGLKVAVILQGHQS